MSITAQLVKELRERTGAGMMECKKALVESGGNMEKAIEAMRKTGQAKAAKKSGRTAAEGVIIIKNSADNKAAFMVEINTETDFAARDESFNAFAEKVSQLGIDNQVNDLSSLLAMPIGTGNEQTVAQTNEELVTKIGENIKIRRVVLLKSDNLVSSYCHSGRIGVVVDLTKNVPELGKDIAMHIAASKPEVINPEDLPTEIIEKEKEIFSAQAAQSGKPQEIIEKMVAGRVKKFVNEVSLIGQPFVKDPNTTVGNLLDKDEVKVLSFIRFEVGEGIEKEEHDFAAEVMAQIKGA